MNEEKDSVEKWAQKLTQNIYKEYDKNYPDRKYGIKVFYSPVRANPRLMIISFQPGGNEKNYKDEDQDNFEKGDFCLQTFNSYSETDDRMSQKMREIFSCFNGGLELLKTSVVFPLIFFRAPSKARWSNEMPREKRVAAEAFCFSKVKEIIEKLQPANILVVGLTTYDLVKQNCIFLPEKEVTLPRENDNHRRQITSEYGGYRIFAMPHPTGSHIAAADWNALKKSFSQWISKTSKS